jgi:hypothetical protein
MSRFEPYLPYIMGILTGAVIGGVMLVVFGRPPSGPRPHRVMLDDGRAVQCVTWRGQIACDFTR